MRKVLIFTLVVIIMLTLCSCGDKTDAATEHNREIEILAAESYVDFYIPTADRSGLSQNKYLCRLGGTYIVQKLVETGALPEGSELLSMEFKTGVPVSNGNAKEISYLKVNMNEEFKNKFARMKNDDQTLVIGSLVNTLLDYTDTSKMKLTVCGNSFETDFDDSEGYISHINKS